METRSRPFIAIILLISTYMSACAQKDYYYGSNIDSTQQSVVDVASINIVDLVIGSKIDDVIRILGKPYQRITEIDEVDEEKYTTLYYGESNNTFFDFHHSNELGVILIDFDISDSLYVVTIDGKEFKVGEGINRLKDIFPKSYLEYINDADPHKSFQLIVFENNKRMGLEILFLIKEEKIHNISTRYDE